LNPQIMFLLQSVPDGRVFGLDGQTLVGIIIQLINVGMLAFFLSKILYNPVRNYMANRAARIQDQISAAEKDKADANEMKALYESKVKEINKERDEILETARKQAAERSKQLLAEAKAEADSLKARAAHEIDVEKKRAMDSVKEAIIDISSAMATRVVKHTITRETQEQLFNEAMAEVDSAVFRAVGEAV